MTFPSEPVPVPAVVLELAAGRDVQAVWHNELGGLTFRIQTGADDRATDALSAAEYVKTGPGNFDAEAQRLAWASRYVRVPQLLGVGPDWLHTLALPGYSAVDPRWAADPAIAARAAGVGLRILHDRLPVESCPFDWSVPTRLAGIIPSSRAGLADPPPIDRLVVCHGDACTPNTLLDAAGSYLGHVDLDALGVADRWADLAVATMSLDWNFDGDWAATLLDAYGVDADPERIDYYRRLWDAPERS